MGALDAIADWPVPAAAAAVVGPAGVLASHGELDRRFPLASVTKPLVARAAQVAVEEGAVDLDTPAGPPGSTVRHLLAHTSGLAMLDDKVIAKPGSRRVYSNFGFRVLAEAIEAAAGIDFGRYLAEAVFEPLAMTGTTLDGGAAVAGYGGESTVDDLARFRRRTAGAAAGVRADARGRDVGAVPRACGCAARIRCATPQRLGPGVRDPRRQGSALDGGVELGRDVSGISASQARSSGLIRPLTWRWWCSPTGTSATGPIRCGLLSLMES